MPLTIKDDRICALAEELAGLTGETVPQSLRMAIEERLARVRAPQLAANHERLPPPGLADELDRIALDCARLPVRDDRGADEILGYDAHGLPV